MLLVLFLHSTARRLRQALWQFTPQAAAGAFVWVGKDGGRERFRDRRRGRAVRGRGRERRRERRRDGKEKDREWGGERRRGSDRGMGANRNIGANGRASDDQLLLLHSVQIHEHWHIRTVRPTVPDNNSVNRGESKRRGEEGHRARQQRNVRVKHPQHITSANKNSMSLPILGNLTGDVSFIPLSMFKYSTQLIHDKLCTVP